LKFQALETGGRMNVAKQVEKNRLDDCSHIVDIHGY
jgi:hypothetical protein